MIISLREIGQTQPRLLRDPKMPPFGFVPPEGLKPNSSAVPAGEAGAEPAPGAAGEEPAPAGDKEAAPKKEADDSPQ